MHRIEELNVELTDSKVLNEQQKLENTRYSFC